MVKGLGASECQVLKEMSDAAFGFLFCERSNGNNEMDSGSTFWMRIVVDVVLELVGECSLMELWRGGQVICEVHAWFVFCENFCCGLSPFWILDFRTSKVPGIYLLGILRLRANTTADNHIH